MSRTGPERAVVLVSGGLDSATVLASAVAAGRACIGLSFDYGQRHRHELEAAGRVCSSLGAVGHVVLPVDLGTIGGSALTAPIDVPKDRPSGEIAGDIPRTYGPGRNLIFLSIAAALAEVEHASEIHIGVSAVDYSGYPDCRPAFVESFERTVNLGTRAGAQGNPLRIVAPLIHLTKARIIQLGLSLGVDYSLTHSCYDPVEISGVGVLACGRCDSCFLRARGFSEAAVPDPTRYAPGEPPADAHRHRSVMPRSP
ncbi:MAG: 7-cyano-7-deazaguanine synthase QueC [Phycisphaerae bacterium]|nr:7-cyano-7-deazaguanine synthase QueC [Phycisphaerae bacterium]